MSGPSGFFVEFFVSAAVGGLIGVEREHRDDGLPVIAGVRTFPLIAIAGFLTAVMAQQTTQAYVLAAGVLGAFGLAYMFMHMRMSVGQTGITTPVTIIIAYLLGVAIGYHFVFEATVVGVVTTALLVTKKRLHKFAAILDDEEILSALQFITLVFILLPLTATYNGEGLPVGWIGRGKLVDPYSILLVSVLVAGLSFASLVAMRQIGPHRGLQFGGLMGGLVNSEATTASLAERAKEDRALVPAAVAGSLLASTTMLVRNFAIASFADPSLKLALRLAPFFLVIAAVGVFVGYRSRVSGGRGDEQVVRVKNPFAVLPALRFALYFAAVSVVVTLATQNFGEAGVYVAALGGFVSAGAVIASIGTLVAHGNVSLALGLRTALLATAASIGGKLVILRYSDREMFQRASPSFAALTAIAVLAALASFIIG